MTMKNDAKLQDDARGIMRNLTKFDLSTRKSQKFPL